jgi:hypothetical protein
LGGRNYTVNFQFMTPIIKLTSWLFQGQENLNANYAERRITRIFLLSFAEIRPICAFRVKSCYKIKKMSSDLEITIKLTSLGFGKVEKASQRPWQQFQI